MPAPPPESEPAIVRTLSARASERDMNYLRHGMSDHSANRNGAGFLRYAVQRAVSKRRPAFAVIQKLSPYQFEREHLERRKRDSRFLRSTKRPSNAAIPRTRGIELPR